MFHGISSGSAIIAASIHGAFKFPSLFVPIIFCWLMYAPTLIYLYFDFPWEIYSFSIQLAFFFLWILFLSSILSWSCFVLLELVRQIETNESQSFATAIGVGTKNTVFAFPIVIVWASIWFLISVVEMILDSLTKQRWRSGDEEKSLKNVAMTLGGYQEFSLSAVFFEALRKGVRMITFLIFPAIAWERKGIVASTKKGISVATTHFKHFAAGYALTWFAAFLIFLPASLLIWINGKFEVDYPDGLWIAIIIYIGFSWSLSMLIEQLFVAELYLWHLIWEKEKNTATDRGDPEPSLEDVKRPSIIDGVPDMFLTKLQSPANKRMQSDRPKPASRSSVDR